MTEIERKQFEKDIIDSLYLFKIESGKRLNEITNELLVRDKYSQTGK